MRTLVVHGGLFVLTLCSMTLVMGWNEPGPWTVKVGEGLLFAGPAALILASHEMGHFLMARAHGVDATWPYFLPLPAGFGTLGAVIRLKGTIPSRNALFDIGVAGPLAGLLVALPMLVVGTLYSAPGPSPSPSFPPSTSLLHYAVLAGQAVRHLLDGVDAFPEGPPALEVEYLGDNLLTWGISRLVWGKLPAGVDLQAHPVFLAAWFGMLVTALNLLPAGQLDGGHVTRAFFGPRAETLGHHVASALLILATAASVTWLVWFFILTRLVGFGHPPPTDDQTPLSTGRRVLAVVTWALTLAVFIPVPIDVLTVPLAGT